MGLQTLELYWNKMKSVSVRKSIRKAWASNPNELCLITLFLLILILSSLSLLPESQSELIREGNRNVHVLFYLLTITHVL